jgi:hypothetical protein
VRDFYASSREQYEGRQFVKCKRAGTILEGGNADGNRPNRLSISGYLSVGEKHFPNAAGSLARRERIGPWSSLSHGH